MQNRSEDTLVLIPARMAATRLPDKPLADIAGKPMVAHVWQRASEAGIGPAIVCTDSEAIVKAVKAHGGQAVLTRPDHASGSDRIFEALEKLDPDRKIDFIVNVQGDLPTIDPQIIRRSLEALKQGQADIATLGAEISNEDERDNPNVVKIVGTPIAKNLLHALYFTRAMAPYGDGPLYHHIGLYAYRRKALERFIALPPSTLEKREKLEQLRALEDGMRIEAAIVNTTPLGVDTPDDLEKARQLLSA